MAEIGAGGVAVAGAGGQRNRLGPLFEDKPAELLDGLDEGVYERKEANLASRSGLTEWLHGGTIA